MPGWVCGQRCQRWIKLVHGMPELLEHTQTSTVAPRLRNAQSACRHNHGAREQFSRGCTDRPSAVRRSDSLHPRREGYLGACALCLTHETISDVTGTITLWKQLAALLLEAERNPERH